MKRNKEGCLRVWFVWESQRQETIMTFVVFFIWVHGYKGTIIFFVGPVQIEAWVVKSLKV